MPQPGAGNPDRGQRDSPAGPSSPPGSFPEVEPAAERVEVGVGWDTPDSIIRQEAGE
jgi:hypothetical protein